MLSSCMSSCIGYLRDKYHSTTSKTVTYLERLVGFTQQPVTCNQLSLRFSHASRGYVTLFANKTCPPIPKLNSKNDGAVLSLKTLELFPGVCCCGWQGWTWIELKQNWTNFVKKITGAQRKILKVYARKERLRPSNVRQTRGMHFPHDIVSK